MALAVATKVIDGRITSSFGSTPSSSSAACSAAVPLTMAMAWRTPVAAATISSNCATYLPADDTQPVSMQSSTSSRSRAPNRGSCSSTGRAAAPSTASTASSIARVSSAAGRLERTEGLVIASQIVDVLAIARQVFGSVNQAMVCSRPLRKPSRPAKRGDQPSSFCALALLAQSRSTSLRSGRSRTSSCSISMSAPISSAIICAVSPIEISKPLPILMTSPMPALVPSAAMKPLDGIGDEVEVARRMDAAELDLARCPPRSG